MGKNVVYGLDEDTMGNKLTTVHVYAEDCQNAVEVLREIEEIVGNSVQGRNPTAFWRHLIRREIIDADEVKVTIKGDFVDEFVEKGYGIGG